VNTPALVALSAIGLVGLASALIGSYGVRMARSTSDFLVASRTVGPVANAGAISGEYLSAASFLGIAGLILREGADALWYPVAFVAGYLALLLFVAAPLRRSGAHTVPDFAELRLASTALRITSARFVSSVCRSRRPSVMREMSRRSSTSRARWRTWRMMTAAPRVATSGLRSAPAVWNISAM